LFICDKFDVKLLRINANRIGFERVYYVNRVKSILTTTKKTLYVKIKKNIEKYKNTYDGSDRT